MDLAICATLTVIESYLPLGNLRAEKASNFNRIIILFLVHYCLLKFYRIYIYPRYFSPLRHLPGPRVRHLSISTVDYPVTKSLIG